MQAAARRGLNKVQLARCALLAPPASHTPKRRTPSFSSLRTLVAAGAAAHQCNGTVLHTPRCSLHSIAERHGFLGCSKTIASPLAGNLSLPHTPQRSQLTSFLPDTAQSSGTSALGRGFAAKAAAVRRPSARSKPRAVLARPSPPRRQVVPQPDQAVAPAEEAAHAVQPHAPDIHEIADVVSREALIITRNVEWGTIILGFEQANKYTVLDQDGRVVALMAEDADSLGSAVGRQLLRTHRSFVVTIFSPDGSRVLCKLRRPFRFINSSIFIEDGTGAVVGEMHQRWHLWKRNYDLYLGKRQFASIEGGLLAWEFVLRDGDGGVLALLDRNFQGFGKELFTDAGKYVVHFGERPAQAAEHVANTIQAAHPDKPRPPVTTLARARNDLMVIPTAAGDQLDVVRSLGISERTAVLAAAVSIDFDYFSQHSSSGSGGMFPFLMPMPMPDYPAETGSDGADGGDNAAAGDAAGADVSGGGFAPMSDPGGGPTGPMEGDLGGDTFGSGSQGDGGWGEELEGDSGEGWGGDDADGGGGGDGGGGFFESIFDAVSDS